MGNQQAGFCGYRLKRQLAESPSCQKSSKKKFQLLILLCVMVFIMCLSLSDNSLAWWQRFKLHKHYDWFFNHTDRGRAPPYQIHLKHRVVLITPHKTTEPPVLTTPHKTTEPPVLTTPHKTTEPPALTTPHKTTEPPVLTTPHKTTEPPVLTTPHKTTEPPALTTPHKTTEPPTLQLGGILYHQAFPGNYHFIMDNTEVCRNKMPFLVLMVPVAPSNIEARDAIRQTWGKDSTVKGELVLTLFMLGLSHEVDAEKLKQENEQHHDLIQSNFMDTYLNLTIKTMVIMDWLAKRCPTAAYAMKVDSDMFLNIDNLVIMLQKPNIPKMNYLTGLIMWNIPVIRSKNSKWYVPEEMYPEPLYPTYTLGMGYIFSNDLPEKFVEVSKSIKPFNIEDAYIGMCMKKLGYAPTSPPDPSQFQSYSRGYNRCEYSKIITYILGSPQDLKNYWENHKKPGPYC